jgi:ketosteroid isomerase-like protein
MAESLARTVERMNRLFAESRWDEYFAGVSERALGTVVTSTGSGRATKAEFRALAARMQVVELRVWDLAIREIGDTGLALFKHVQRQTIDGVRSDWTGDATDVYVREADGVWRLASWHFNGFDEQG